MVKCSMSEQKLKVTFTSSPIFTFHETVGNPSPYSGGARRLLLDMMRSPQIKRTKIGCYLWLDSLVSIY